MADSTSAKGSAWYDTLKGIAKCTPDPELRHSPARKSRSYPRRVSLMESAVSPATDVEAGEARSPVSERSDSTSERSSVSSFSFSHRPRLMMPPDPSDAPLKDGAASKTTKERALPPFQLGFHGAPLPLPPPPAAVSSPVSTKKALEYSPGVLDFEYHPRSGARYQYPSGKTDLESEPKPRPSRRPCSKTCYWWFCATILLVVVVSGIAVAVCAAVTNPKLPSLEIGDLAVTSLNFTEGDGEQLKTAMNFSLKVRNPNRYAQVIYSQISAIMFYKELSLNNVTIPGFAQGKRTSTTLSGDLPQKVTIVPSDTVGDRKGEIASSNVHIILSCSATGKFKILGLKVKGFSVPVDCQLSVKPEAVGVPAGILEPHSCYYL